MLFCSYILTLLNFYDLHNDYKSCSVKHSTLAGFSWLQQICRKLCKPYAHFLLVLRTIATLNIKRMFLSSSKDLFLDYVNGRTIMRWTKRLVLTVVKMWINVERAATCMLFWHLYAVLPLVCWTVRCMLYCNLYAV